jgi:hypothetical protein
VTEKKSSWHWETGTSVRQARIPPPTLVNSPVTSSCNGKLAPVATVPGAATVHRAPRLLGRTLVVVVDDCGVVVDEVEEVAEVADVEEVEDVDVDVLPAGGRVVVARPGGHPFLQHERQLPANATHAALSGLTATLAWWRHFLSTAWSPTQSDRRSWSFALAASTHLAFAWPQLCLQARRADAAGAGEAVGRRSVATRIAARCHLADTAGLYHGRLLNLDAQAL